MRTEDEIKSWMVGFIADILQTPAAGIDLDMTFERLGLDSSSAVALIGDLESWLERDVDPTLPYDYPTVRELAAHLATQASVAA